MPIVEYKTIAYILLLVLCLAILSIPQIGAEEEFNKIYIKGNGTVEGTDKIQQNGNVYSFTDNIVGTLVVQKNNITIDGAGYTLSANSGIGVDMHHRHYVTVKNLILKDTYRGFEFTYADDNTIVGNTLINSGSAVYFWWAWRNNVTGNTISKAQYAFHFFESPNYWCQENIVAGNTVYDSRVGLSLIESKNIISDNIMNCSDIGISLKGNQNVFRNNTINCSGIGFKVYSFNNDIDASNYVNGKPIIYWINHRDETVPSEAGYVVLSNCDNIKVQDLNANGLSMYSTTNSLITRNTFSGGQFGIQMFESSNNTIRVNSLVCNEFGLQLDDCHNNEVVANNISSNSYYGLFLTSSHYNNIKQNHIVDNGFGRGPNVGSFPGEHYTGDYFGVKLLYSSNNHFIENNVAENSGWGIRILGNQHDNILYHNNFIDNGAGNSLQVSMLPPSQYAAVADPSTWDNGASGNYWSDYQTRYPNASEISDTGIGDTPFYINDNNIDHYPLMEPMKIQEIPSKYIISEFPAWLILPLFFIFTLVLLLAKRRIKFGASRNE